MKICPSCGYGNAAAAAKCAVCGRGLEDVPVRPVPPRRRESGLLLASGALILLCGAAFFFGQRYLAAPAGTGPSAAGLRDEAAFGYEGVLYSLDRMGEQRYLPREDRLRALPLLRSGDDRVALSAAKLAGGWLRDEEDPAAAAPFMEALLGAALNGAPEARKQAALEIGMAAAGGFRTAPYSAAIRGAASALVAARDAELVSSGYFMAAACGLDDFREEMLKTLRFDPSSRDKLYAACSLACLGDREGYLHLISLAGGGDGELREDALACLAYSSVPGTDVYLSGASVSLDTEGAAQARRALILREQLAIIKK